MHYIWTPVLPGDDRKAATAAALRLQEPRAHHWWDPDRTEALLMAKVLGIDREGSLAGLGHGIAWDVYMAYGRGKHMGQEPDFWMHQLNVTHAPRLDAAIWLAEVRALLAR